MSAVQNSNSEQNSPDRIKKLKYILSKKKRSDEDIKTLLPFIQNIEFFKNYNFEKKDLEYICQQLKYFTCWEGEKVFLYNSEGDKWITDYEKTEVIKPQYFYIILSGEVKVLLIDRELKRTKDIALIEAFKILKDHNSKVIDRIALLQNDPNIQELVPIIDDLLNESLDQANNEDWFIDEGKSKLNFLQIKFRS